MICRHSVKSVQIRSFFWSVFSRIQSEYGNIQTTKDSVFGHFSRSENNGKRPPDDTNDLQLNFDFLLIYFFHIQTNTSES